MIRKGSLSKAKSFVSLAVFITGLTSVGCFWAFGWLQLPQEQYEGENYAEAIGEAGFEFRWADREDHPGLGCEKYDSCTFIEVTRLNPCNTQILVSIKLVHENDVLVERDLVRYDSNPIDGMYLIEIGTTKTTNFEYYEITDVTCEGEDRVGQAMI